MPKITFSELLLQATAQVRRSNELWASEPLALNPLKTVKDSYISASPKPSRPLTKQEKEQIRQFVTWLVDTAVKIKIEVAQFIKAVIHNTQDKLDKPTQKYPRIVLITEPDKVIDDSSSRLAVIEPPAAQLTQTIHSGSDLTLGLLAFFGLTKAGNSKEPGVTTNIFQYLLGTNPVSVAVEEKAIIGLPNEPITAKKMRINLGPVSLAAEQTNTGRTQFDVRLGTRPGGIGVAIKPGEESVFRPYGRMGWMQFRVKYYSDHVSIKIESTSRAVNNLGKATELRVTRQEWDKIKSVLNEKGEAEAAAFLEKKYGVRVSGLRRMTSIAHGVAGFLGEMALFLGVGVAIDELAEHFDFDPNFKGRGLVQVGSTLMVVQALRALWHKFKTGELPNNLRDRMTCATTDTAATLLAFDSVGHVIDGFAHDLGVNPDFTGRLVLQFAATAALVIAGKQLFKGTAMGQMCSAVYSPPKEKESKLVGNETVYVSSAVPATDIGLLNGATLLQPGLMPAMKMAK